MELVLVVTVIYSLLQYYCNNNYTRKHHYYCLHVFMTADNFWLRLILLQSRSKIGDTLFVLA
jgi:hypothetical protein